MLINYLHPALTLLSCHAFDQCWLPLTMILRKTKGGWWIFKTLDSYLLTSWLSSHHNNPLPHSSFSFSCSLFPSSHRMTVFLSFSQLYWDKETSIEILPTFASSPRAGPQQRSHKVAEGKHTSSQNWCSVAIFLLMFLFETLWICIVHEMCLIIKWAKKQPVTLSEFTLLPFIHYFFAPHSSRNYSLLVWLPQET